MASEKRPTIPSPLGSVQPVYSSQPTHSTESAPPYSRERSEQRPTLSWRSILAGTLIALLTYFTLLSLGVAIGSSALQDVLSGQDSANALGWGSGIWFIASVLISLFVGSYTASRVSGMIPIRVGRIQGAVISALFFGFMLTQIGSALGLAGRGVGQLTGAAIGSAAQLAQNPQVQASMDEALGDLNLRSDPKTVAQGIASRLLQGDSQGARRYLAQEAGISQVEADRRINDVTQRIQAFATETAGKAAKAGQIAGWSIFGALVLGTLLAMLGGGMGARANFKSPLTGAEEESETLRGRRAA